ncbi:TPA: hypothetical protein R1R37_001125 [Klebsiella aerogenes]|uniref:hypothetical protein n=1 Tax=Klebsiella aerogenes TaxID=548 RepID=UPI00292B2DDB|nr:hypothetical protein [Klebsiella aerogenes]HEC1355708.1 hypothetical protein [Klebsiella aerogenes]
MSYAKREHGVTRIREGIDIHLNDELSSGGGGGDSGGGMLEKLERRVERLETDLTAARMDLTLIRERSQSLAEKSDVAVLTERSDSFATKVELAKLVERSENFATKAELAKLVERSEQFATKADLANMASSINSRITWSIMIPLAVAAIGFLVKVLFLK